MSSLDPQTRLRGAERGWLERALAGEALPAEVCAELLGRLGRARDALRANDHPDWREAYDQACEAIEAMLRQRELDRQNHRANLDHARELRERVERRRQRDVGNLELELRRVKEERDDALQAARDAFAAGRRSAA